MSDRSIGFIWSLNSVLIFVIVEMSICIGCPIGCRRILIADWIECCCVFSFLECALEGLDWSSFMSILLFVGWIFLLSTTAWINSGWNSFLNRSEEGWILNPWFDMIQIVFCGWFTICPFCVKWDSLISFFCLFEGFALKSNCPIEFKISNRWFLKLCILCDLNNLFDSVWSLEFRWFKLCSCAHILSGNSIHFRE
jgi:hypothetical protein